MAIDYTNAINVQNIDTFWVTGGGYTNYPIKGATSDSLMGWDEATWSGELTRNVTNFALTNIDTVDFGSVFRFEVNIKYLNYADYKVLRDLAKQRFFSVRCFNRDTAQFETHEMTFTKAELTKLYVLNKAITKSITDPDRASINRINSLYTGALDTNITLVATNRENANLINTTHTISYNSNGGTGTISSQTSINWGDVATLSNGSGFTKSGYTLKGWATKTLSAIANDEDEYQFYYNLSQQITVWEDITLYAIWEANS